MDSLSGLVAAMEQARDLTGLVCSPEEETAAFEEFTAWARTCNLRGSIYRTISTAGRAVWHVEVTTDRGALGSTVDDPRSWREAMVEVGLLTTTKP